MSQYFVFTTVSTVSAMVRLNRSLRLVNDESRLHVIYVAVLLYFLLSLILRQGTSYKVTERDEDEGDHRPEDHLLLLPMSLI